jgi:hypothetical protein
LARSGIHPVPHGCNPDKRITGVSELPYSSRSMEAVRSSCIRGSEQLNSDLEWESLLLQSGACFNDCAVYRRNPCCLGCLSRFDASTEGCPYTQIQALKVRYGSEPLTGKFRPRSVTTAWHTLTEQFFAPESLCFPSPRFYSTESACCDRAADRESKRRFPHYR